MDVFLISPLWKLIYHKGSAQRLGLRHIDCWKCFSACISPAVLIMIPPTPIHLNAVLGLAISMPLKKKKKGFFCALLKDSFCIALFIGYSYSNKLIKRELLLLIFSFEPFV